MKNSPARRTPRFIVDQSGNKVEVILDINVYNQLLEELEDAQLAATAEKILAAADEELVPHEQIKKNAKK